MKLMKTLGTSAYDDGLEQSCFGWAVDPTVLGLGRGQSAFGDDSSTVAYYLLHCSSVAVFCKVSYMYIINPGYAYERSI